MSSPDISETKVTIPDTGIEKEGSTIASSYELPSPGREHLHFVPRKEELLDYGNSGESITGYDASLMRARATLSNKEEKQLLRRIDWHLIPLLAVMYMLKSIDALNVHLQ